MEARGTLENEGGTGPGPKDTGTPLGFKCQALELAGRRLTLFSLVNQPSSPRWARWQLGPETDALSRIRLESVHQSCKGPV